jgi:hypothetical protein
MPNVNSRESAEILKQQIISNQEIVQQFRNYYKSNRNTMSLGLRVTFEEILEGKK